MVARVIRPLVVLAILAGPAVAAPAGGDEKLDPHLQRLAAAPSGKARVIVRTTDGLPATSLIHAVDGTPGLHLATLGIQIAEIPHSRLRELAAFERIAGISLDRPVQSTMERTATTIGARWVTEHLSFDGTGVGIATIDSGITPQHDDFSAQQVAHFADFVNFQKRAYDDYGHGTHVAGILAGSGDDSSGARRGIAPGAKLVVLKALDGAGGGHISNVIAAIEYAITNRDTYNIRVINLSVAAGVYEPYDRDPLTLAAKRAVDAGIVVVAAAGNLGRAASGRSQYGGITSPGNAPWVLTVGASSHMGTDDRSDDRVAAFSSRGLAGRNGTAKPDLVAPGVAVESTAEPSSVLFAANPASRVWGTTETISQPYLRLSGTSMSAPVVAGTVALMLQANRSLTPNAVKAILQYTAEDHSRYDPLTQGAGFLNARGAVELAATLANQADNVAADQDPTRWSRHIIWGDRLVSGGSLTLTASAWARGVVWGSRSTPAGEPVVWGTLCEGDEPTCSGGPWQAECEASERCGGATDSTDAPGEDSSLLTAPCEDAECSTDLWGASDPVVLAGSIGGEPKPAADDGWLVELAPGLLGGRLPLLCPAAGGRRP